MNGTEYVGVQERPLYPLSAALTATTIVPAERCIGGLRVAGSL
jgi:hypothetical protein